MRKSSYIYAVQAGGGLIKIGVSKHPLRRLNDLQTANGESLKLLGVWQGNRQTEWQIHDLLKPFHRRGEWFLPAKEVLEFIEQQSGELCTPEKIFKHFESEDNLRLRINLEGAIAMIFVALAIGFFIGSQYGYWVDDKIKERTQKQDQAWIDLWRSNANQCQDDFNKYQLSVLKWNIERMKTENAEIERNVKLDRRHSAK